MFTHSLDFLTLFSSKSESFQTCLVRFVDGTLTELFSNDSFDFLVSFVMSVREWFLSKHFRSKLPFRMLMLSWERTKRCSNCKTFQLVLILVVDRVFSVSSSNLLLYVLIHFILSAGLYLLCLSVSVLTKDFLERVTYGRKYLSCQRPFHMCSITLNIVLFRCLATVNVDLRFISAVCSVSSSADRLWNPTYHARLQKEREHDRTKRRRIIEEQRKFVPMKIFLINFSNMRRRNSRIDVKFGYWNRTNKSIRSFVRVSVCRVLLLFFFFFWV